MLFLEENAPSVRLAMVAGALVAGEAAGFALWGRVDASWAWTAYLSLIGVLAAYGRGVRGLAFAASFLLGVVLALRADARLKDVLDGNSGLYGPRLPLDLVVEGDVARRACAKTGGWIVDFASHAGPVPLKVLAHVTRGGRQPRRGETWRADGWISRREDRENRYGRRMLWVPEARPMKRVAAARENTVEAGWNALGMELAQRAGEGLGWCPEMAGLNRAILLGRRSELPRARKRAFADAGTIHVFAISGLHVMVVAWLLNAALGRLNLSSRARGLVCLPLVWAYVVLTGGRPSAIRAAGMASLMLVAPALGRRPDSLAAWSVTALVVYVWSPERMFDLGCALSFTVMFGIVLWCHWVRHFSPWFEEGSAWERVAGNFGVSFAAWVAGVPLAAHAFGRFTPGGLLANLAVLWCAKWMVKFGTGGLAASFICLPLAALLNNLAAAFTWAMAFASERVASIPCASFEVEPWSVPWCAAWYGAWFLVLLAVGRVLPRRGIQTRRWWK